MDDGPLTGVRVVEMAGLGTVPFAGMLLGDMGAEVLRIDRPGDTAPPNPIAFRNRRSMVLDLKTPEGLDRAKEAIHLADVLVEGFRPGVMERLGLGPAEMSLANPGLVYGRITGWGQAGPLAQTAGHDINYIAVAGALEPMGNADRPPTPPLNLVGDYGAGSLYLVLGILAALVERMRSGRGQIVDAAIVDGAASMIGALNGYALAGRLSIARGGSMSGDAPNFRCYACSDGRFVALGCIEPRFYHRFLDLVGWEREGRPDLADPRVWPQVSARLEILFRSRPRDEWIALLGHEEACLAPVLSVVEAADHPQLRARATYIDAFGFNQPAPAPRFSRTPGTLRRAAPMTGEGGAELLDAWRCG